jgi:hypothetical protein
MPILTVVLWPVFNEPVKIAAAMEDKAIILLSCLTNFTGIGCALLIQLDMILHTMKYLMMVIWN